MNTEQEPMKIDDGTQEPFLNKKKEKKGKKKNEEDAYAIQEHENGVEEKEKKKKKRKERSENVSTLTAIPKTNSFIVRGTVEAKSAVESGWKSLRPGVLVSDESGDSAVAIERTQTVMFFFHCL
ncbi:hypothetical protein K1719_023355 [Acacia pycnantha]|nr:hypothetical protein K1719_023355 [Acacia pycnantha]